jgi:IS605 OrfB family transposase
MKLVANIKLTPTAQQHTALLTTLETANAACTWLSGQAWTHKTFGQFKLHALAYGPCRERFGLSAQMVVRCIAKVADAYKLDHKTRRRFRKHAAQPYDERIFRFRSDTDISIWTLEGRLTIPYQCGERQRALLAFRKGEVDLMYIKGQWYIACVCDVSDPEEIDITGVLGIDLGIVNLAVDSEGNSYSGGQSDAARRTYAHRRRNLQRKGTRAATRKLRQISGRQARFQRNANHRISKAIVRTAQRNGWGIALEALKGIRNRIKARRQQRGRFHNWAFYHLRQCITYKAQRAGIPVIEVDPRYTSQECRRCFHVSRSNRRSQAEFLCTRCGYAAPADVNAARNIRVRALVNAPMVAVPRQLRLALA